MKRQMKKTRRLNKKSQKDISSTETQEKASDRRSFLLKARNYIIASAVVGGGGWFAIEDVRATMREHDLSRIGNGIPAVVQIHDPNCNLCVSLQREARNAMSAFEDDQLQFMVANIISAEGRKLAAAHGVGHVTLLLFDGAGKRQNVFVGPNKSEYLRDVFRQHLAKHRPG